MSASLPESTFSVSSPAAVPENGRLETYHGTDALVFGRTLRPPCLFYRVKRTLTQETSPFSAESRETISEKSGFALWERQKQRTAIFWIRYKTYSHIVIRLADFVGCRT